MTKPKKARTIVSEPLMNLDQLQWVFETMGVGLWDWQVQTGACLYNEQWARIVGYTLEELAPLSVQTWIDLCHPDDLAESDRLLKAHFSGETERYHYEARMRHKSGHWVWVLDQGRVVQWDAQGRPLRMTGTHLDITERKQMEEALRKSEAKYRAYIEHAPEAIFVADEMGRYIEVNPAACAMTGYSRDELLNMTISDLNWFTRSGEMPPTFIRLQASGHVETEVVLRSKAGAQIYTTLHAVALEGGRYLAFSTDITLRKEMEQQLRIKNLAIESATSAIGLADLDGHILDVNPSFLKLWKLKSKKEIIGKPIWETADSPERVDEVLGEVMAHGSYTGEGGIVRSDGARLDVTFTVSLVYDEEGTPLCIMASFLDISERLESERHLRISEELIGAMPVGLALYQFEPPDRLILVKGNPEAKALTGIDHEQWIGHELNEIWPNAKARGFTTHFLEVIKTGRVFEKEDLALHTDQNAGTFRIKAFPLAGQQLAVAFEDITARKQAETALFTEKERAQLYLDIAGVMFIALDQNGNVTLANRRAVEILNCSESEIIGKNWFKTFIPQRMRNQVQAVFKQLLSGEIALVEYYENTVLCKGGGRTDHCLA